MGETVSGSLPSTLRSARWRPARLLAALMLGWLFSSAAAAPVSDEYQLKAVFLFNFTQFIEWPDDAFADPGAPFVIGVLGEDPFGATLEEAVRGEKVNGRALVVQRYRRVSELRPCQILYIDRSARSELDSAARRIDRRGMLTVADAAGTAPANTIIGFVSENRRIRLRINIESARQAGLTISSKLLRPAQIVGDAGAG